MNAPQYPQAFFEVYVAEYSDAIFQIHSSIGKCDNDNEQNNSRSVGSQNISQSSLFWKIFNATVDDLTFKFPKGKTQGMQGMDDTKGFGNHFRSLASSGGLPAIPTKATVEVNGVAFSHPLRCKPYSVERRHHPWIHIPNVGLRPPTPYGSWTECRRM